MLSGPTIERIKRKKLWSVELIQHRFNISKDWATAIKDELIEMKILDELPDCRDRYKVVSDERN